MNMKIEFTLGKMIGWPKEELIPTAVSAINTLIKLYINKKISEQELLSSVSDFEYDKTSFIMYYENKIRELFPETEVFYDYLHLLNLMLNTDFDTVQDHIDEFKECEELFFDHYKDMKE